MTENQLKKYMSKVGTKYGKGSRNFDVIEVFGEDDDQLWYDIPLFPAYQISNKGYVRSFKRRNIFPYGSVMVPRNTDINGVVYQLTDKNNVGRRVSLKELEKIADRTNPYYTTETNSYSCRIKSSRNARAFINFNDSIISEDIPGEVVRKPAPIRKENCEIYHFSTIPDPIEDKQIIRPIRFEGEE